MLWRTEVNGPVQSSPLVGDGKVYFGTNTDAGTFYALNASDGSELYSVQRLEGIQNIFTSPLGVKDRIYIQGTEGTCVVVKSGDSFEVLAQNTLEDSFYASPVVIGDRLYLRGDHYLYCISAR